MPFARPENFARVLENFDRQRFPGKRIVLVANGPAAKSDASLRALNSSTVPRWLTSGAHQSTAKNEALSFIRKQGGGFFATMDDDDWYGPSYLDEVAGYARSYQALGKQWHFVSLGEDLPTPQLLLCNRLTANREVGWLTGGTISGWAEDAADFEICEGEDLRWCSRMEARGAKIRGLSIYHYLYRRSYAHAAHTWAASRDAFLKAVAHNTLEFPLTPDGKIDLDIVSGDIPPTHVRLLGKTEFKPIARSALSR